VHLLTIREEERMLMAREIHDELGQNLTALKMDLSWLKSRIPGAHGDLKEKAGTMDRLLDSTIETVKRLSAELRPGALDVLGLQAAVEWQAEEFEKRTGIACELSLEQADPGLDDRMSTALFRIFQEALTNVARHAGATRVRARIRKRNGSLELVVEDNGRGIGDDEIQSPASLGLLGMRERALSMGGEVAIKGKGGAGTKVKVRIPLKGE
jgi:signal transduction histidine kinase